LITILCLLVGGFIAMPFIILNPMINVHMDVEIYSAEDYGVTAKPLILKTEDGLSIASWITGTKEAKGIVILLSGIQSPSVTAFWGYAKMLEDNGYASLLIEMRGHGDRVSVGMEEWLDVKAGVEYIKGVDEYKNIPIIIWGTSMGAATAINSIGKIPEIDGVISFSAYSTFADVFCDYLPQMGIPAFVGSITKPFVNLYLGLQYGFDKLKISPINEIQNLNGRPMLLAHSTEDSQVAFASFERLKATVGDSASARYGTPNPSSAGRTFERDDRREPVQHIPGRFLLSLPDATVHFRRHSIHKPF
jgi:pimeloyl-ACP methyl ester carboxylesterase